MCLRVYYVKPYIRIMRTIKPTKRIDALVDQCTRKAVQRVLKQRHHDAVEATEEIITAGLKAMRKESNEK
jgi:histone H3/H4